MSKLANLAVQLDSWIVRLELRESGNANNASTGALDRDSSG